MKNNVCQKRGARPWAYSPFERIQVDFAEMPKVGHLKYLLVIVDQLTGWPEAFATSQATAKATAKVLLEEIIPRFGPPWVIESDHGKHFKNHLVQTLTQAIGSHWAYHVPWHPKSSGQAERMNGIIKKHLTKICQEAQLKWTKALPIALTRIRATPNRKTGLTPYELLFGRPYPIFRPISMGQDKIIDDEELKQYVTKLQHTLSSLQETAIFRQDLPADTPCHQIEAGDWVLVKEWKDKPLTPKWTGPYRVLLTINTAIKTDGKDNWIHHSRVKKTVHEEEPQDITPKNWSIEPIQDLKYLFRKRKHLASEVNKEAERERPPAEPD